MEQSDFWERQQAPLRLGSQPLIKVLLAGCTGIAIDRWVPVSSVFVWWTLASLAWIGWWFAWRQRWYLCSAWLLLMCAACFWAGLHHRHWYLYPSDHIIRFATEEPMPVALLCRAKGVPELSSTPTRDPLATISQAGASRLIVEATQLREAGGWRCVSGKVDLWVGGHLLGVRPGSELLIFGELAGLPTPRNPGERDWGLADRSERVVCRVRCTYPDCVSILDQGVVGPLARLSELRAAGLRLLDRHVAMPRSVLAGALLLGSRDRLESARTEVFFHTGTIHLLAISGLHVGILVGVFFFLAHRLPSSRRRTLLLLMVFIVIYCLVTGMRTPVLRASALVFIVCFGMIWRRQAAAFNALAAAALFVLILRPSDLFRPGAQLSFLAVATLMWLSRHFNRAEASALDQLIYTTRPWYHRAAIKAAGHLRQLALAGFAIWLVTSPW